MSVARDASRHGSAEMSVVHIAYRHGDTQMSVARRASALGMGPAIGFFTKPSFLARGTPWALFQGLGGYIVMQSLAHCDLMRQQQGPLPSGPCARCLPSASRRG